jgi:histidinol dehydrogenase
VRLERLALDGDPAQLAQRVRALTPQARSVEQPVREILERVRAEGDDAVLSLTRELDTGGLAPAPLRVPAEELTAALDALDPDLRAALELAIANVRAVAQTGLDADAWVALPAGQRVVLREVPVRRAAVYVPGGRAPYPSTVVMGAVTAQAAGVGEVAVCAPPGPDGQAHPVILAACALCAVAEVYRMGGAQAIGALAYGTESVPAVDVIVGPGNPYVTEAKRQVYGHVGIDGLAGPSELVVLLGTDADARLVALDLLAQAEHGADSPVIAVSPSHERLGAVGRELGDLIGARPSVADAPFVLVSVPDLGAGLAFADAFAPEHLELVGAEAEALAPRVRAAGCVFVGAASGTAFGDYVAGSNHVLPTGGAARFASALSPRHFRRRMAQVEIGAASEVLAPAGARIARAEGFAVHAESMEARMRENGRS